jgi:hypothetical protein
MKNSSILQAIIRGKDATVRTVNEFGALSKEVGAKVSKEATDASRDVKDKIIEVLKERSK